MKDFSLILLYKVLSFYSFKLRENIFNLWNILKELHCIWKVKNKKPDKYYIMNCIKKDKEKKTHSV